MFRRCRFFRSSIVTSSTTASSTASTSQSQPPVPAPPSPNDVVTHKEWTAKYSPTTVHDPVFPARRVVSPYAPPPELDGYRTPRWVMNLAGERHGGWGVYKTKQDVVQVLQALRVSNPPWWCSACDEILSRMLAISKTQPMGWGVTERKGAIIVVEGLDGVGKTTVTQHLAVEQNEFEATGEASSSSSALGSFFSGDGIAVKNSKKLLKKLGVKNQQEEGDENQKQQADSKTRDVAHGPALPGAVLLRTPSPVFDAARAKFRLLEDPIARAFYCACNYIAAATILRAATERVVVVDRWWNSTAVMALAQRSNALKSLDDNHAQKLRQGYLLTKTYQKEGSFFGVLKSRRGFNDDLSDEQRDTEQMISLLPDVDDSFWEWPVDLPRVDLTVLLDCPEEIRMARIRGRGGDQMHKEEHELAAKRAMRETALEGYRRMYPPIHIVECVPNYAAAVNTICDIVSGSEKLSGLMPHGKPNRFSEEFIESVKPF